MNDTELLYSATARCRCGAGLAYPLDHKEAMKLGAWVCSAVLLDPPKHKLGCQSLKTSWPFGSECINCGAADHDHDHDQYPWLFYKIREETSVNNHGGATTRPKGTVCRTVGHAKCSKCQHEWKSDPYVASVQGHHWCPGDCPGCGYGVGDGSLRSDEWPPIDTSILDRRSRAAIWRGWSLADARYLDVVIVAPEETK